MKMELFDPVLPVTIWKANEFDMRLLPNVVNKIDTELLLSTLAPRVLPRGSTSVVSFG